MDFIGSKLLIQVDDEGLGNVKEDIPYTKGATLKFEGCSGDCSWNEIKVRRILQSEAKAMN